MRKLSIDRMFRKCSKCGEWKDLLNDFGSKGKNKRRSDCKKCYNARVKELRLEKIEKKKIEQPVLIEEKKVESREDKIEGLINKILDLLHI